MLVGRSLLGGKDTYLAVTLARSPPDETCAACGSGRVHFSVASPPADPELELELKGDNNLGWNKMADSLNMSRGETVFVIHEYMNRFYWLHKQEARPIVSKFSDGDLNTIMCTPGPSHTC